MRAYSAKGTCRKNIEYCGKDSKYTTNCVIDIGILPMSRFDEMTINDIEKAIDELEVLSLHER